jgi:hypothetical protein
MQVSFVGEVGDDYLVSKVFSSSKTQTCDVWPTLRATQVFFLRPLLQRSQEKNLACKHVPKGRNKKTWPVNMFPKVAREHVYMPFKGTGSKF